MVCWVFLLLFFKNVLETSVYFLRNRTPFTLDSEYALKHIKHRRCFTYLGVDIIGNVNFKWPMVGQFVFQAVDDITDLTKAKTTYVIQKLISSPIFITLFCLTFRHILRHLDLKCVFIWSPSSAVPPHPISALLSFFFFFPFWLLLSW